MLDYAKLRDFANSSTIFLITNNIGFLLKIITKRI